ncbi:hypothetical protein AAAX96_19560, partial [Butyricimonas faecihominis]|uniref:hypothetical protein n=1 Tax=Butyricimonas faecihominis TaxID=1472416 RepID=UPI0032C1112E
MKDNFNQHLNQWLQEVANGCHEITTNPAYNMDIDFYVFQSNVTFQPKLMIIGSNPRGNKEYSTMNHEQGR